LTIQGRKLCDELLVGRNRRVVLTKAEINRLRFAIGLRGALRPAQGIAKSIIEVKGYDGFRELIQVSAKDVGGIVDSVSGPV